MSSSQDRSIFGIDVVLILATVSLMVIGVLFIYSSGVTSEGQSFSNEWIRQIVWAGVGIFLLVAVSATDYSRLRDLSPYLYGALLLVLVGTLMFGRVVNGARSWIGIGRFGVQPSEFMKVATILFLARHFDQHRSSIQSVGGFALSIGIVLVPMFLILLQPDLGTALVYLPVFLIMAYVAGARVSHVAFVLLSGIVTIILTVLPAWEQHIHGEPVAVLSVLREPRMTLVVGGAMLLVVILSVAGLLFTRKSYFKWISYGSVISLTGFLGSLVGRRVLQDYQIMRLIVFLNPNVDPRGAGWNIIQSVTAVGSGGIAGKGWLHGTQSHLQYLPQQSTDFIFSILAEEWGFIGAFIVFACFTALVVRGLAIATKAKDSFASLVAVGVVSMIFFHVAVNVGMAIGIMPITGIPLLFLSYGGSSLWTALIGVGLLMSIYQRRFRY
jgi:rod shape determining protein RodA